MFVFVRVFVCIFRSHFPFPLQFTAITILQPSKTHTPFYFRKEFQLKIYFFPSFLAKWEKKTLFSLSLSFKNTEFIYMERKKSFPTRGETFTYAFHVHKTDLTKFSLVFFVYVAVAYINNCEMWTIHRTYIRFCCWPK